MNELLTKHCLTAEPEELSLAALMENSKKPRIKSIAARYGVKVSDKNTKPQMIEAVKPIAEVQFKSKLRQYTPDDLALLLTCFRHAEISEETAMQLVASAPFEDGGVYLLARKERFFPKIPRELAGRIMSHIVAHYFGGDTDELSRTARACARIYGVFTPELLARAVNAAYGTDVTPRQAADYLTNAAAEEFSYADGQAVYAFAPPAAVSPLAEELEPDFPTRREIEAYAFYGLDSHDYYYRQIVNCVYNNAGGDFAKANEFMRNIAIWSVTDGTAAAALQTVQHSELPLTQEQFNFLLGMLGELAGRTRRQSLKGHIYSEVEGTMPIRMPEIRVTAAPSEPVKALPKVGRNDPCPCGSGKKYKKCCGRNQ